MKALLAKLGVDETYSKPTKKPIFDHVKDNTFPKNGYNAMADLLFLPETKTKYKYLLTMVDLWSNRFDMEPLRTKEPKEVLDAMETIFKRKYLKEPKASLRTDNGNEFKGVFHKWLYDHNILQRVSEPYRHQQLSNVENLNKQLGRILNGYMNMMETKSGKPFKEWTDILDTIRKDLNKTRTKTDLNPYKDVMIPPTLNDPIYKVGDLVVRKLERPQNALGKNQNTLQFRVGDIRWDVHNPRKIIKIVFYPNNVRYILDGLPNVSYTNVELKKVTAKVELPKANTTENKEPVYFTVDPKQLTKYQYNLLVKNISKSFLDTDDNITYVITDIVRKKRDKTVYYKYYDYNKYKKNSPEDENEYEYTDVNIFLNAKWVKYKNKIKFT